MSDVQDTESKIISFKIGSFVQLLLFIIAVVFLFGGVVARGEYNRVNLEEKQQINCVEITTIKSDVKIIEKDFREDKSAKELEMQEYRINQTHIIEILTEVKEDLKELKKRK